MSAFQRAPELLDFLDIKNSITTSVWLVACLNVLGLFLFLLGLASPLLKFQMAGVRDAEAAKDSLEPTSRFSFGKVLQWSKRVKPKEPELPTVENPVEAPSAETPVAEVAVPVAAEPTPSASEEVKETFTEAVAEELVAAINELPAVEEEFVPPPVHEDVVASAPVAETPIVEEVVVAATPVPAPVEASATEIVEEIVVAAPSAPIEEPKAVEEDSFPEIKVQEEVAPSPVPGTNPFEQADKTEIIAKTEAPKAEPLAFEEKTEVHVRSEEESVAFNPEELMAEVNKAMAAAPETNLPEPMEAVSDSTLELAVDPLLSADTSSVQLDSSMKVERLIRLDDDLESALAAPIEDTGETPIFDLSLIDAEIEGEFLDLKTSPATHVLERSSAV